MTQLYQAFGMKIRSELPLRLPAFSPESVSAWPVSIDYGPASDNISVTQKMGRIVYGKSSEGMQVDVPWAASFQIQGDSQIVVSPVAGAIELNIALYITGLILPFLLRMRPLLILHGSAVSSPKGALAFVGHQGSGKSTTAAALAGFGYQILCDDIIPVDEGSRILPGISLPKLLPDAYENLVGNPGEALHLFDGVDKYQVDLGGSTIPAQLRALFILESGNHPRVRIEKLLGGVKLQALLEHVATIEGLDDPVTQFTRCSSRLGIIPVFRISRPTEGDHLTEVLNKIIQIEKQGYKDDAND